MRLKFDGKYVAPLNEGDTEMFKHCTNGHIAVTQDYFDACRPVFAAHGIIFTDGEERSHAE